MALYIETKIRYDKVMENGISKKVTEPYLVDALSFTEAEARITEEISPYISGEFSVSAVKKTKIAEVFRDSKGDRWYNCRLAFITIDEKTAQEKRTNFHILVQASDFRNVYENLIDGMKGTMSDFEIVSISETPILDVYTVKTGA
ncbi:MAG: DUF4494 domain-containing protein [Lachnospiraceae bacterium]|nr:DUF4494 domain-containing protein [Lachnospiraceae bacterium]